MINQHELEQPKDKQYQNEDQTDLSFLMLQQITLTDIEQAITQPEEQDDYENLQQTQLLKSRSNCMVHSVKNKQMQEKMKTLFLIQEIEQKFEKTYKMLKQLQFSPLWKKDEKQQKFNKLLQESVESAIKINRIRKNQIKSISYLFDHEGRVKKETFEKYFNGLGQFSVLFPSNNQGRVNIEMALKVFQLQTTLLDAQQNIISNILGIILQKSYLESLNNLIKLQQKLNIINSKLLTIAEVFPYASNVPFSDLICLSEDDQRKKFLSQYITFERFGTRQEIRDSFIKVKEGMNVINSIMGVLQNTAAGNKSKYIQILKCLIFKDLAHHQSEHMMANPSTQIPKNIWNLTDKTILKPFVSVGTLPSIQYSEKIYIPRILSEVFKSKGEKQIPSQIFIQNIEQYFKNLYVQKPNEEGILLRINSPIKLQPAFKPIDKKQKRIDKLIVHFHGSGFIGFSTFVHQAYIRNWANNLGVPIISVDYAKAPQYPYPCAIQDCFEGLLWAIYCFSQIYHAQPTKIVLVGDSSGGNLALVLNNILLEWKIFKLSGVVSVYPALNLNFKSFTPSLLSSLNDMILPHTFLKICLKCYLQDPNLRPDEDPYISPLLVSSQTIQSYPPVQIFVGDVDAFYDDCMRMAEKINKIQPGKCRLTVFEEFPHGFIMFDMKLQHHGPCQKATKQVEEALRRLLC